MANRFYPLSKNALMTAGVNLATADIRVCLVDLADYTYSPAHEFLSSVPSGARDGHTPVALASKTVGTVAAGVFDAADTTLVGVTGDPREAAILFVHTGSDATARMLWFFDTGVTGLPFTPPGGGGDCTLQWNASGIFAIND
jgi:hypothetical protein